MKAETITFARPRTLSEVAEHSRSLQEFGLNLRDWQHEIQRGGVHNRKELAARLAQVPSRLAAHFEHGDVADAYLAAYAEWLADKADIPRPHWCSDPQRTANDPWFSTSERGPLLVRSPASFRQRNLFTIPDSIFIPRCGRPRASSEHKREKARQRQRAYRSRISELVREARSARLSP